MRRLRGEQPIIPAVSDIQMPELADDLADVSLVSDETVADASSEYWISHNVTSHHQFISPADSLEYFDWRNDQYFGYIDLMPVTGQKENCVLDYGCGPGHDLVGFTHYSHPSRLIGIDVSAASLAEARARLTLHNASVEFHQLEPNDSTLPLDDDSVDYIHSSGVLHHIQEPSDILKEFRRVLKPAGRARIMVYNQQSIWYHLYVAYQRRILQKIDIDLSMRDAFARSTDGPDCPISRCYLPDEFIDLCQSAGFKSDYLGAAISAIEAQVFQTHRYNAIQNRALPAESRAFLIELEVDRRNLPIFRGDFAGIDGCFELTHE